jgi:hypothetical protein
LSLFRLGYIVYMIQQLIYHNEQKKLHVFYDIACVLKSHLEVKLSCTMLWSASYAYLLILHALLGKRGIWLIFTEIHRHHLSSSFVKLQHI